MATMASMMRELGWRLTLDASTALLILAIAISLAARGVFAPFWWHNLSEARSAHSADFTD